MKTSYLIIGGVVLAAGAYWYTHRATQAAAATAATSTKQTTTSKVLGALGSSLQAFSNVFTKPATAAKPAAGSDSPVARVGDAGLDFDVQLGD